MNTTQRNSWDALSLREKSEMMKVAVQNGIYKLSDIKEAYNEYAEGGPENIEQIPYTAQQDNTYVQMPTVHIPPYDNSKQNYFYHIYDDVMSSSNSPEYSEDELFERDIVRKMDEFDSKLVKPVMIGYDKDRAFTLTNAGLSTGAHLSGELIDYILREAEKAGIPAQTALGIVAKESTLGNPTDDKSAWNLSSGIREQFDNVYPGTSQHINTGGDALNEQELVNFYGPLENLNPYTRLLNDAKRRARKGENYYKVLREGLPYAEKLAAKPVPTGSIMQQAFEYFRDYPYKYNPKQSNYPELVEKRGIELMQSPEIQKAISEYNKNRSNKFLRGGPLIEATNKYDGTTEESQQMDTADLSNSRNAWYSDFERRNGRKPTWWDNYKRNLYNLVNPAEGYPTGLFDTISKGITGIAAFLAPNSVKVRRGNNIEPVSEAAWAKRLDMPYDESLVVDNGNNTYRLPKQYEQEIPVDTTMLKKRIEDNQKLADSPNVMGEQWRILNKYIEADKNALDSLRYTYATGEPVVINEFSYNSRNARDENGNIIPVTSPLNVLQNYTVQYDKDNNAMNYRDIYDFNQFEPFVPGKPFVFKGVIPLKKSYGGPLVELANKYDGYTQPTQQMQFGSFQAPGMFSFLKLTPEQEQEKKIRELEEVLLPERFTHHINENTIVPNNIGIDSKGNATYNLDELVITPQNNPWTAPLTAKDIKDKEMLIGNINQAQETAGKTGAAIGAGLAATAAAVPLLSSAPSWGTVLNAARNVMTPGSSFWTNPLTRQMMASTLVGETVNAATKQFTPFDSWGQGLSHGVEQVTGYNPSSTIVGSLVMEGLNPGYSTPYSGIQNAVNTVANTYSKLESELPRLTAKYKRLVFGNKHQPNIIQRMLGKPNEHDSSAYKTVRELFERALEEGKEARVLDDILQRNPFTTIPDYAFKIKYDSPVVKEGQMVMKDVPISIKLPDHQGGWFPLNGTTKTAVYTPGEVVYPIHLDENGVWEDIIGNYLPNEAKSFTDLNTNNALKFSLGNDDTFNTGLRQYVQELEDATGYPVVGSTRLISEGYYGGVPGDTEILVPSEQFDRAKSVFNFYKSRDTRGGTGVTGHSNQALIGKDRAPENLDINVLREDGTVIHQMESTRNPDKMPLLYDANARASASGKQPLTKSAQMKIPKEDGSGYYTAEEYFNDIKNDKGLITQSVVDNNFKSGQDKHLERAYVMMNSDKPEVIESVSKAIDHMVAQVPGMKRFSQLYTSQKFDNVEANKEMLEKMGFLAVDADKFASNPQQMKNIVDYWYMRNTVGTRSVNYSTQGGRYENRPLDEVMGAVREFDNGSGSGGGGNETLGSKFGGFTRDYTAYNYHDPMLDKSKATFDDVFNYFERERTIWKDRKAVTDAIKESFKELGLENLLPSNIRDYGMGDFTSQITDMIKNEELTAEQGDTIIKTVSEKLGVSGYRGGAYGDRGMYFGAMQRPGLSGENSQPLSTLRNIDSEMHNEPILPAEWGSDKMFFRNSVPKASNNIGVHVNTELPMVKVDDAIASNPNTIRDLRKYKVYDDVGYDDEATVANIKAERDRIQAKELEREEQINRRTDRMNSLRTIIEKEASDYFDRKNSLVKNATILGNIATVGTAGYYLAKQPSRADRRVYMREHEKDIDEITTRIAGRNNIKVNSSEWFAIKAEVQNRFMREYKARIKAPKKELNE